MTPRQLEILQHALGCDKYGMNRQQSCRPYEPYYRNHFCGGEGDREDCEALVVLGYMQRHKTTEWLPYYNCSVTPAGIKAMIKESPVPKKPTRSQQRFREYRNFSDAYDCTFKEFLQIQKTDWYKRLKSGLPLEMEGAFGTTTFNL